MTASLVMECLHVFSSRRLCALLVLVVMSCHVVLSNSGQGSYDTQKFGRQTDKMVLTSVQAVVNVSRIACCQLCLESVGCMSASYYTQNQTCLISDGSGTMPMTGWSYYGIL